MPLIAEIGRPSWRQGFARSAAESAYPELWSGLLHAYCPALGSTGATVRDLSRFKADASENGTPEWIGGGISFDGSTDYYTFSGATLDNEISTEISVFARVRCDSIAADQRIVHRFAGSGNPNRTFLLWMDAGGSAGYGFIAYDSSQVIYRCGEAKANAIANQWQSVFGVYDASSIRIYVDGGLADSAASGSDLQGSNVTPEFGRWATEYFSGDISSVYIWNRALAHNEVAALSVNDAALFVPRRRTVFNVPAVAGVTANSWYYNASIAAGAAGS